MKITNTNPKLITEYNLYKLTLQNLKTEHDIREIFLEAITACRKSMGKCGLLFEEELEVLKEVSIELFALAQVIQERSQSNSRRLK